MELKAIRERGRAMAEADAAAKANADAKFLVEEAKLKAEEKCIALSDRVSSVTSSRRGRRFLISRCRYTETPKPCGATPIKMHENFLTAILFHQKLI